MKTRLTRLALAAAQALREQLDACRHAAYTVYAHLDENGISVGIVFRLSQLRERMVRIRQLLDCLQSEQPAQATARLLAQLALVGQAKRSIRALIASSTHLTAAKVAERSAESGEHYITRNVAEYRHMLATAAGGGAVLASLSSSTVGTRNAEFVLQYLQTEKIPVVAKDLLDAYPRKIYFFPSSGRVLVRKLHRVHNDTLYSREKEYRSRLEHSEVAGDIELFT